MIIYYLISGALLISFLIVALALRRLANRVDLLQRELRSSNDRLREDLGRLTRETREEREAREQKESDRRTQAKKEEEQRTREKAEREMREREQAVGSSSSSGDEPSSSDEDEYCRCSSPGGGCTWK